MNSRFPEETKIYDFSEDAKVIDFAISVIKSIRKKRKELNVPAGKILNEIFIETDKLEEIEKGLIFIKRLARVKDIKLEKKWNFGGDHGFSTIVADCAKIFINNEELFNKEEEILKLKKELEKTTLELNKVVDQLKNEAFLKKAPEKVVNKIKSTKASLTSKMEKIKESISDLSKN
jgi:valyl-tRNA synthetase